MKYPPNKLKLVMSVLCFFDNIHTITIKSVGVVMFESLIPQNFTRLIINSSGSKTFG